MHLEYALDTTTLGDVLGKLYRAKSSAIVEVRATTTGELQRHRLYIYKGLVCGVESPFTARPFANDLSAHGLLTDYGRRLLDDHGVTHDANRSRLLLLAYGLVSEEAMREAVRRFARTIIDELCGIDRGAVHVLPISTMSDATLRTGPLSAEDFLYGRPRARDRIAIPTDLGPATELARRHEVLSRAFAAFGTRLGPERPN